MDENKLALVTIVYKEAYVVMYVDVDTGEIVVTKKGVRHVFDNIQQAIKQLFPATI